MKISLSPKIKSYWITSNSYYSMQSFEKFIKYFFDDIQLDIAIGDENSKADGTDGMIYDIQDCDIIDRKLNIMLSVENCKAYNFYNHYNKYGDYENKKIKVYLYNHIDKIEKKYNYIAIPIIYVQMNFFKKFYNTIIPTIITPKDNKKFCLIATCLDKPHKHKIYNFLSSYGKCDLLQDYRHGQNSILNKSCYHDETMLNIFNQYKFVFVCENSTCDGFITEKIFNCFFARTIPIYYGSNKIKQYFNPNTFFHISNALPLRGAARSAVRAEPEGLDLENLESFNQVQQLDPEALKLNNIINSNYNDENYKIHLNSFIQDQNKMKKVISFSLWGTNEIYLVGAIRNVKMSQIYYPDFECWIYVHKDSVPNHIIQQLEDMGVNIIFKTGDISTHKPMTWRFEAIDDPMVEVMMSRDTDTQLLLREKLCVDEWLKSDKLMHIMRDHPYHNYLVQGGMFGIRKPTMFSWVEYINKYCDSNNRFYDQVFLRDIVYPIYIDNMMIHASFNKFEKNKCYDFPITHEQDDYKFVGEYVYSDESRNMDHIQCLKANLNY